MAITLFKVSDFSINRKPVCHVLLANNDKILRPFTPSVSTSVYTRRQMQTRIYADMVDGTHVKRPARSHQKSNYAGF